VKCSSGTISFAETGALYLELIFSTMWIFSISQICFSLYTCVGRQRARYKIW